MQKRRVIVLTDISSLKSGYLEPDDALNRSLSSRQVKKQKLFTGIPEKESRFFYHAASSRLR